MSKTNRKRLSDLQKDLKELEQRFSHVKEKLRNNESYLEQIQDHNRNAQQWKSEIESHKKQSYSDADSIASLEKDITSTKEAMDKMLNSTEVKKDEIDKFFLKVFGVENSKGEREGGLSQRLEKKEKEVDNFLDEQEEKYNTLYSKIQSLLPAATSTGLAKAFFDQKGSYFWPKIIWGFIFIVSLGAIVLMGYSIDFTFEADGQLENTLSRISARLPYFFALIWLAGFSSKRYRQNSRLQEEYAHKEVLAKSYQGYKKEFESDDNLDNDLVDKLKNVLLEAIRVNPGKIIDSGNEDDSPSILKNPLDSLRKNKSKSE